MKKRQYEMLGLVVHKVFVSNFVQSPTIQKKFTFFDFPYCCKSKTASADPKVPGSIHGATRFSEK
jgi:hypothetical protein